MTESFHPPEYCLIIKGPHCICWIAHECDDDRSAVCCYCDLEEPNCLSNVDTAADGTAWMVEEEDPRRLGSHR